MRLLRRSKRPPRNDKGCRGRLYRHCEQSEAISSSHARLLIGNAHGLFFLSILVLLLSSCASSRYESYWDPHTIVASWYGQEFHGRLTASGEKFDMYQSTCAHNELPFGTVLEVRNISNGKTVKCVVNDRGPFVSGRDLDLSYGAAKEIGLIGAGTGPVRITLLGRYSSYIKEVKYDASNGPFTIQIASFTRRDNALHLKAGLELKYKGVYIIEATAKNATHYRVRIGKFMRKEEASSFAKTIAEEGYSPLITRYDERA
ncbi:MAG TPA: septal ring lytic transglycosylase RlpA family protein [Thermodesulfovibrionales bacterium]|nr:septal ring lytic transglycosylase RlpA family protein [Thermodesulfovibrionales bacterium]